MSAYSIAYFLSFTAYTILFLRTSRNSSRKEQAIGGMQALAFFNFLFAILITIAQKYGLLIISI